MNKKITVVFCKEEHADIETQISLFRKYAEKEQVIPTVQLFTEVEPMLFALAEREYLVDLLFIDTQIHGKKGMKVVEELRRQGFRGLAIFLTKQENKWEEAFDIQAFHYIIQNRCKADRFEWILSQAFAKLRDREQEMIAFTCAGERVLVAVKDIQYFEVKERWVIVHYLDQSFEFFARMGKIEQTMAGKGFIRIHRSYLVSIDYVASIRFNSLTLLDKTELSIGRGRYQEIKQRFEQTKRGEYM